MIRRRGLLARLGFALAAIALTAPRASAQVRVVDMIPRHFSNEWFQNAEPTIAVNPVNPNVIAASAYTLGGDICSRGVEAPIFVSVNAGATWDLVCKIHVDTSATLPPGDVSLRWARDGSVLYASLLWPYQPQTLQLFQVANPLDTGLFLPMNKVVYVDQPELQALSVAGHQRVFVGANFMNEDQGTHPAGKGTAAILVSGWLPTGRGDSLLIPVEFRNIAGENYAIRLATHPSGTVYALIYSPRNSNPNAPYVYEDVVVVRDDSAGTDKSPFRVLLDTPVVSPLDKCKARDGLPGVRVVSCRYVPYNWSADSLFGYQRRMSANLSIAVDPATAMNVWVAWADSVDTNHYMLHVRRSTDGGHTWSPDRLAIPNATNPALAVATGGNVGFLFQQLDGAGTAQRWVTKFLTSTDGFTTKRSYVLSSTPARSPPPLMQPYIGDYEEVRAVGNTFYGVFSANNTPDTLNFPNGISFQRNVNLATKRLLNTRGGATVQVSIDPFFFSVGPAENPACTRLRAQHAPRMVQLGCAP
jgi:hypothetical protein